MLIGDFINQRVNHTDSILDIGCGNKQYSKFLRCKSVATLDAWKEVEPNYLIDLNTELFPFPDRSFDVILMIDFIEHLSKRRGLLVLEDVKRICKREIILMTPLIWDDNTQNTDNKGHWCYGNPYNYHASLWEAKEFMGWRRYKIQTNKYYIGVWSKNGEKQ